MAVSPVGGWNVVTNMNNAVLNITGVDGQGNIEPGSWIEMNPPEASPLIGGTFDESTGRFSFQFRLAESGPEIHATFLGYTFQAGNPLFNFNAGDGLGPVTGNPANMMAGSWSLEPDPSGRGAMGFAACQFGTGEGRGNGLQSLGTWNVVANSNNSVLVVSPGTQPGAVAGNLVAFPSEPGGYPISGVFGDIPAAGEQLAIYNQLSFDFPYLNQLMNFTGSFFRAGGVGQTLFTGPPGPVSPENAVWDLIAGEWAFGSGSLSIYGGWVARANMGTWPDPESFEQLQQQGFGS